MKNSQCNRITGGFTEDLSLTRSRLSPFYSTGCMEQQILNHVGPIYF